MDKILPYIIVLAALATSCATDKTEGACKVDEDCPNTEWCTNTWYCAKKLETGTFCPNKNKACRTGFCSPADHRGGICVNCLTDDHCNEMEFCDVPDRVETFSVADVLQVLADHMRHHIIVKRKGQRHGSHSMGSKLRIGAIMKKFKKLIKKKVMKYCNGKPGSKPVYTTPKTTARPQPPPTYVASPYMYTRSSYGGYGYRRGKRNEQMPTATFTCSKKKASWQPCRRSQECETGLCTIEGHCI